jgi:hypothetical protein
MYVVAICNFTVHKALLERVKLAGHVWGRGKAYTGFW